METNRKKSVIYLVIIILAFLGNIFISIGIVKILAFLLGLGFAIMMFTNSMKIVKSGDKAFGIPFLILAVVLILFFALVFLMGNPTGRIF